MLRASLQCQVPSDPSRGASAYARALAPSAPISLSAAPAATSSGRLPQAHHHIAHPSSKESSRAGSSSKRKGGFGEHVAAPLRFRVLKASLQCQVPSDPSDPSRGASASARALAPSSPILLPAAPAATSSERLPQASLRTTLPSKGTTRASNSSKGRGGVRRACSRTTQVQGVEGLVAVPGAVRPLPRGQRIRQGLGPLVPDRVPCRTSSNIIRAPPSGPSPHGSSLLKGEQ